MQHARKLTRRALRDRAGEFLIEGPAAIAEALDAGVEIGEVFVTPDASDSEVVVKARAADIPVTEVTVQVLDALSDAVTPQGVVAIARMPAAALDELAGADLVVVLAEVRDPGNAGTLVRSALAAGAGGVVFTERSVDPYGPKTVRASAGAVLRTKVIRDVSLGDTAGFLREDGFRLVGADAAASVRADEADLSGRVALVLGNEAWGLPEGAGDLLDEAVGIGMPGPVESLNVAVAGSILLFECVRQRRAGRG